MHFTGNVEFLLDYLSTTKWTSVAIFDCGGDNRRVENSSTTNRAIGTNASFTTGAMVLVTLNGPREKFWGAILDLNVAGLTIRGIDLNSFEDFAGLVRDGEPVSAGGVFFPMHRVERIELDTTNGAIPSLSDRFRAKSGRAPNTVFQVAPSASVEVGCTLIEAERRFVMATLHAVQGDYGRAAKMLGTSEERLRQVVNPQSEMEPR